MIFCFISEGELAPSEFGELDDLVFGMRCILVLSFVVVSGRAMVVSRSHVNVSGVFA